MVPAGSLPRHRPSASASKRPARSSALLRPGLRGLGGLLGCRFLGLLLRRERFDVCFPPLRPPCRDVFRLPSSGKLQQHGNPAAVAVGHVVNAGVFVVLDCLPPFWPCVMPASVDANFRKVAQEERLQAPVHHVVLPQLVEPHHAGPVLLGELVAEVPQQVPVAPVQHVGQVAAAEAVHEGRGVVLLPEPAPVNEPGLHRSLLVTPEEGIVEVHVLVCQAYQVLVARVQEGVQLPLGPLDVQQRVVERPLQLLVSVVCREELRRHVPGEVEELRDLRLHADCQHSRHLRRREGLHDVWP
mmetsp:Transcript_20796/g.60262  ORF Transcript_20796/g.60262 Transcript_20796/m.60262 type:complete len:299 (-) Transcript_20796:934-1830(-)